MEDEKVNMSSFVVKYNIIIYVCESSYNWAKSIM